MADWPAVKSYIRSNYNVENEPSDDLLVLRFHFEVANRKQAVYLTRHELHLDDSEWLQIASIVGVADQISADVALKLVEMNICGGLQLISGLLAVAQWQPLASIDALEIDTPITLVTSAADRLEAQLTGKDVN
ncbi:MAG: hypothetical protein WBB87_01470 [Candidatus Microthrix parvicella]|jgi:hypothetical protein|nr:hypothetical protein [Candidatus Microthrix sp.]MBK7021554.1 hypothetical protein [Candidatus Microthrix sp.]